MDVEKFIQTLKSEQAATAVRGTLVPRGRDAFEYGLMCGLAQGYERALQVLQELQDAADGKLRSQRPIRPANPYLTDLDSAPTLPEQMGRSK